MNTPVLLLVFNRLETTKKVFLEIRKLKPKRLYVASDGPRDSHADDFEKVTKIRSFIENSIDWDCELETLFRDENLGCGKAVSGAVDWLFENEEYGIILEDDTVPDPTFFPFCEEMLERFKYDERVGMISGNNWQPVQRSGYSYHFSSHGSIWGWATWRRAWEKYDYQMKLWDSVRNDNWISSVFLYPRVAQHWNRNFDAVARGLIDTWDYRWTFARYINRYLTIRPNVNLVKNVGFGGDATHTDDVELKLMPAYGRCSEMSFPLVHPPFVVVDKVSDTLLEEGVLKQLSAGRKIKRKLYKVMEALSKK